MSSKAEPDVSPGSTRTSHCVIVDSDLSGVRLEDCRWERVELRSNLRGRRGGDALRGVTISSDQLIPAALVVFAAMKIRTDDE